MSTPAFDFSQLLEKAARIRDHADSIFVRERIEEGRYDNVALTELPAELAIGHVLRLLGLSGGVARTNDTPERLQSVELFAWIGEDEYGSGEIGLKQARMPAGYIPLVVIKGPGTAEHGAKLFGDELQDALNTQAVHYGKKIYLCRFRFAEVLCSTPEGEALK
jgi:hypothetical protein